jgi:hypothetical protein
MTNPVPTLHISILAKAGVDSDTLKDIDMVMEMAAQATFAATIDGKQWQPYVLTDVHDKPLSAVNMTRSSVLVVVSSNKPFLSDDQVPDRRMLLTSLLVDAFDDQRFVISFGSSLSGAPDQLTTINEWATAGDPADDGYSAAMFSINEALDWSEQVRLHGLRAVYENLADPERQHRFMMLQNRRDTMLSIDGTMLVPGEERQRFFRLSVEGKPGGLVVLSALSDDDAARAMVGLGMPEPTELAHAIAAQGHTPESDGQH